jgi:hypothetical protein
MNVSFAEMLQSRDGRAIAMQARRPAGRRK